MSNNSKSSRRRSICRGAAWATLWLLCGLPLGLQAATEGPAEAKEPGGTMRLYTQRAYSKVREGSLLMARDKPLRPADLRSPLELRRDAELVKHYSRLGQLDTIAQIAHRIGQQHFSERVDVVVRSETQRYYVAMQSYRAASWQAWGAAAGTP